MQCATQWCHAHRERAIALLAAAAGAARALLASLGASGVAVASAGLQAALLAAHAAAACAPEALAALAGLAPGPGPVPLLQVSRLRCLGFQPSWNPRPQHRLLAMVAHGTSYVCQGTGGCARCRYWPTKPGQAPCMQRDAAAELEPRACASDALAAVQARQALAAALRGWVDHDTWAPELVPAVFAPGRPPASADAPHVSAQVGTASAHGICAHPDLSASYRRP